MESPLTHPMLQVVVDMDHLEEAAGTMAGADAVFCALGTTRKVNR